MDTGAQSAVVGLRQAEVYCRFMGTKFKPSKSKYKFRLGNNIQAFIGILNIRFPILHVMVISEDVNVIKANVLFLIGLDLLNKYKMVVNNVHDFLECYSKNYTIPLTRNHGHIFLELRKVNKMLYTYSELRKLYRNIVSSVFA